MQNNKILYVLLSIIIAIVGWTWTSTVSKLAEVEKGLMDIKLELVRINATMVSAEDVEQMIEREFSRRGL